MKNILLPTDFSENSWNAIKYAINFFKNESCNFFVLHVNRFSTVVFDDSTYEATNQVLEEVYTKPTKQQLRNILKRIAKQLPSNKSHKFYTLTDCNYFTDSIRKHVEEKKIDCIVIGTKGASGLKKIIVGSNTADVITKVQCTTLAIPEGAILEEMQEIAFPSDFSLNYNIQILEPLYEILEKWNSSLRILHINKKKDNLNIDQNKSKDILDDYFNNTKHSFHYLTNNKVEDAIQCFVESRNINMICMVAKNLNYFQQILFRSKVEAISYHTEIPFLVLHEKT